MATFHQESHAWILLLGAFNPWSSLCSGCFSLWNVGKTQTQRMVKGGGGGKKTNHCVGFLWVLFSLSNIAKGDQKREKGYQKVTENDKMLPESDRKRKWVCPLLRHVELTSMSGIFCIFHGLSMRIISEPKKMQRKFSRAASRVGV